MDFNKALEIIGKDLEEAGAWLDQITAVPSSANAEAELARARIRSAREMLRLLPGLINAPVGQPESVITTVHSEPVTPTVQPDPVRSVAQPEKSEPKLNHVSEVRKERPATGERKKGQAVSVSKAQEVAKPILADKLGTAGATVGEKISSSKQDEVITSVIHNKPVTDISTAIGINDRFYYIRELFSGDSNAYHETIRRLNAASSLGEAMKILDESTVMGSDPSAQSSFVDVVRRKFSIHV